MTLNRLVFRSMRKNIKHYYLYFFSLIFSVTLSFSFITLQNNPEVEKIILNSGTSAAGFEVGTYILYFIVTFFVFYANHLFMKRRSKEIGLYQLIGMTKGLIIRLIALENFVLFVLAVSLGMILGFLSSRFFALILMKMMGIQKIIALTFSIEAFKQSVIVFFILLIVILIQTAFLVNRVTLLALFQASKKADEKIKRFNVFNMVMGIIGILLIIYGYYESTGLFNTDKAQYYDNLFVHMLVILGSTIFGTFLFFRYSVAFIMNLIRESKKGHLSITDVMAITPIMHRMKSNAKSLTLITVLTGLAVGIMTLSYITYYSSFDSARQSSPYDYILINNKGSEFLDALREEGIEFEKHSYDVSFVNAHLNKLTSDLGLYVIPLKDYKQMVPNATLKENEAIITGYHELISNVIPINSGVDFQIKLNNQESTSLTLKEVRDEYVLSGTITFISPVLVVDDQLFKTIFKEQQAPFYSQIGINLVHKKDVEKAETIYKGMEELRKVKIGDREIINNSYIEERQSYIENTAYTMFIAGFLGLAFLLTTGSILYFKQMSEAEDEKESYTILRKIGFSTKDLMKGIMIKQVFNFGVPLFLGLLHSYFAVKSGWFLFGTKLVEPLIIIMTLYVVMYGIFAILSTQYYKKIIQESL